MADVVSLFRKGSLIPDILSFETDIIERVDTARAEAEKTVAEARDKAEQLISETKRNIPRIAEERRRQLTEQAQGGTAALEHDQDSILDELRTSIEQNRTNALDNIIIRVIPETDDRSRP